jgi:ribose 5-phosphate isomerase B
LADGFDSRTGYEKADKFVSLFHFYHFPILHIMKLTTIAIGCDHAGFPFKNPIITHLKNQGYEVLDFGTQGIPSRGSRDVPSVDYPDFAHPTAEAVASGKAQCGFLICGSGNGVAMTANNHPTIRCGLAWNAEVASLVRQHNDANMLALPARFIALETALAIVDVFLKTEFEGGRHATRVGKMACV